MSESVLIAAELADLEPLGGPYRMATTRDYITRPALFAQNITRVLNLSRSYAYQSAGYYASLLAEARGHKVIPSVETILDLATREGYARALPELEDMLNRDQARAGGEAPPELLVFLGQADDARYVAFARLLFDWFRAPVLAVTITSSPSIEAAADGGQRLRIGRIALRPLNRLEKPALERFASALGTHTRGSWRSPRPRVAPRWSIAVLHDPDEALPPSSVKTLRYWARLAEKQGVEVEPIRRRDLARLAEFDALFIRETTSIRNHTYRFAQRARAEGMPVIDDPVSMIRCTNKVYQWERLTLAELPTPQTISIRPATDLTEVADRLGFPLVVKIPDGSFSRGVRKVDDLGSLRSVTAEFFQDTELLLAQRFMPTHYDWRIGVLGGEPLFACQYRMARNHWQIVNHRDDGRAIEGGFRAFDLADTPREVLDIGVRAARLIGDGFYGVDLKETPEGVVVIEINDNPNLEHGVEDQAGKRAIWLDLIRWFTDRLQR
ncbi:MAG: RimK family protein [Burkholderiaceae bacterium]|nr:RimK family protein [Burkholderiaceae bacterium]